MNRSILIMTAAVTMAGPLSPTALADQKPNPQETQDSRHTVMGHRVLSIAPHWVEEIDGKRTRHLTGADIRIEAELGMTPEYLTVELRRHLSAVDAGHSATDVFGVEGSTVVVRSAGDGFILRVTAPDTKRAREIVRRARLLG